MPLTEAGTRVQSGKDCRYGSRRIKSIKKDLMKSSKCMMIDMYAQVCNTAVMQGLQRV